MYVDIPKTFLLYRIEKYDPKNFLTHSTNCIILVFPLYVPQISEKKNILHTTKERLFVKSLGEVWLENLPCD